MAKEHLTQGTIRVNMMLTLTRAERREFDALSAADLRTPGQMATRIVLTHLAQRTTNASVGPISPGERIARSLPIRLTPVQRRELKARARRDGRTLSNYVTTLVIRTIAAQRP